MVTLVEAEWLLHECGLVVKPKLANAALIFSDYLGRNIDTIDGVSTSTERHHV